jgi:L-proline amide hydrolase
VMNKEIPAKEGFVPFRGYQVWYRIVGDREGPEKLPLLCLHGGPGATHDYLEPLEAIAATGRQVAFYDQLGNGNSARPSDPSLWTVALFVEELGHMRHGLGLDRFHILGQSWGGMLAMEYALTQPTGLASLILADSPASIPQWITEISRLRAELPPDVRTTLLKHEAAGTTNDPAYQEAVMAFYRRHLCRLDPWPDCLNRTFEKLAQSPEVYSTMWGPSEFHVIGTLKNWEIVNRPCNHGDRTSRHPWFRAGHFREQLAYAAPRRNGAVSTDPDRFHGTRRVTGIADEMTESI